MSNEKTRRGLKIYENNPYIAIIKSKTKRITNKRGDMMITSRETGEVINPIAGFWHAEEVDNTKFVKLYLAGIKGFAELSNAGIKVFSLLYEEMQRNINKDKVYLSFSNIDENLKISQATFTRGMRELIEKKFLAPTKAIGWYWINPDYVWNGDRLAFVKEYYKKSAEPYPKFESETIENNINLNNLEG
jgi:hypothetical protein